MNNSQKMINENFSELYNLYSRPLVRYIYGITFDLHKAEDLMHDSFVRLYKTGDIQCPGSERTRNYIFTIARNLSFDYMKRKKREESKYKKKHYEEAAVDKRLYEDAGNLFIRGEIISTINDTIDNFSYGKKNILIQKFFFNTRVSALARDIQLSTYKIKKIEEEALNELKYKLSPLYGYDAEAKR